MLLNLPTEITVECLLGLGIHDLLTVIQVNRRLHAIATHQKSPLRHRLKKRHILSLSLNFRRDNKENPWQGRPNDGDDSNCPEDEDMRDWNEEITMNVNRKVVNDDNWDGFSRWFIIRFWDKCCDKHCANKKVEYAADDIRYPEQLIEGIDDCFWPPGDEVIDIHIKHHNKEEALQNLRLFTHYFSSVYIIGDFNMRFEGDFSPWPILKPFFADNPSSIRCKLNVSLTNVKFDPNQFFDCPIFQKGLAGFSYDNDVQAIGDPSNRSLYNDVLKKTDSFIVYGNSGAALDDDTLIRLFSDVPCLHLNTSDLGVTLHGLARLTKNYYESRLRFAYPNGFSLLQDEKHPYNSEDFISLIPKEACVRKMIRDSEGDLIEHWIVTNICGKKFYLVDSYGYIRIHEISKDEEEKFLGNSKDEPDLQKNIEESE